jgi:acetate kinase
VSLVDEDDRVLADREFEVPEGGLDEAQLAAAVRGMQGIEAIGHRIVHGGPRYPTSVRIDGEVIRYLVTITDLAPLHLPAALAGIAAARELLPRVPAVACLDTAFHSRMPEAASTYAIWHQTLWVPRVLSRVRRAQGGRDAAAFTPRPESRDLSSRSGSIAGRSAGWTLG